MAEAELLSRHARSLGRIRSEQGVVRLGGSVQHELQKDVAMQILRTIEECGESR